jgi:hypothetical protein
MIVSHFFVPIDHSKAVELVPEDEEIMYSTLCHVEFNINKREYWESHVLITNRSIIFSKGKFNDPIQLYYLPWSEIKFLGNAKFDSASYKFKLKRDILLETNEQFLERSKVFKSYIKPIKEEGKRYWKANFPSSRWRIAKVKKIMEQYLNALKKGS